MKHFYVLAIFPALVFSAPFGSGRNSAKGGRDVSDNSGQYVRDNSGQYVPDDSGQYIPDDSGQYVPDDSGQYVPDNSGQYVPDNSGQYVPDNSGQYVHGKSGQFVDQQQTKPRSSSKAVSVQTQSSTSEIAAQPETGAVSDTAAVDRPNDKVTNAAQNVGDAQTDGAALVHTSGTVVGDAHTEGSAQVISGVQSLSAKHSEDKVQSPSIVQNSDVSAQDESHAQVSNAAKTLGDAQTEGAALVRTSGASVEDSRTNGASNAGESAQEKTESKFVNSREKGSAQESGSVQSALCPQEGVALLAVIVVHEERAAPTPAVASAGEAGATPQPRKPTSTVEASQQNEGRPEDLEAATTVGTGAGQIPADGEKAPAGNDADKSAPAPLIGCSLAVKPVAPALTEKPNDAAPTDVPNKGGALTTTAGAL
ncbi:unnamed protein product [Allacma fusca]|uniref:Uncharacterized protein n=1 Tax=Allacma fusca TaxID=39272 RepID=A0A8J2KM14_9HEXA|nr:unnamed protein product [Allacma fusca]